MADISDVSTALVTLLAAAIYPNGTGQASAIGVPVKIFPGWPNSTSLDADLRAGSVQVSVYPQLNMERVTTRYPQAWKEASRQTPSITAAVVGNVVTLGGTVTVGHYVTILIGTQTVASYVAVANDTLSTVATALAGLISGASAVGAAITLPPTASGRITARSGAPATIIRELRRQQRGYQVTIWAPTPGLRKASADIIDPAMTAQDFLTMPDTSMAWLLYRMSNESDTQGRALEYRRDIFWWVEFATTQSAQVGVTTAFQTQIEQDPGIADFGPLPWSSFTPTNTTNG